MSAKLKIGKLNNHTLMKSLTHHNIILSIKFPAVPAINNATISQLIFFIANNRINAAIPAMLTSIIRMNGIGNDREIPVFNVGQINVVSFR